ncbi:MAG: glycerophosphodiester phosphodiesterase [Phycisphaerales bacterium]|nr:MAG: glycerophosphodiester phosphodiesterase [Phycisphaerales bacterium]
MSGIILIGLVILCAILYGVLAALARPADRHPFFNRERVLAIAHRGGGGLWPENTMYAFAHAVELGVDVIEMDVHSTQDGEIVVIHDDTVDRTTNGTGRVQELTLAQLKQLDAGYIWTPDNGTSFPFRGRGLKVPTLAEVFAAFADMAMNIEIKQFKPSIVAPLSGLIREHNIAAQVLVASADTDTLKEFRRVCPQVATSAGEQETRFFYTMHLARLGRLCKAPAHAFQVPQYSDGRQVVTPSFVKVAHGRNMEVHVWTINDAEDMRRLIDMGVDGIVTDYPDRLLTVPGR